MSVVTNVILTTEISDEDTIAQVNAGLDRMEKSHLLPVHTSWHRGKAVEINIYIGAYNHFNLEKFVEIVQAVTWDDPQCVRLFVNEQNDEYGVHEVPLPKLRAMESWA